MNTYENYNTMEKAGSGDVFDGGRFLRYLLYEIKKAGSSFGLSFLIFIMFPLILVLLSFIVHGFGFFGPSLKDMAPSFPMRISTLCVAAAAFSIVFPGKIWGGITSRGEGTSYLMLPASRLEKFLSMLILCLVVLPFCFLAGYGLVDAFCCLVLPNGGTPLVGCMDTLFGEEVPVRLGGGGLWLGWLTVSTLAVVFLPGAVYFKKSKVAKTILIMMGLNFILSLLFGFLISNGYLDGLDEWFENLFTKIPQTAEAIQRTINIVIYVSSLVWIAIFGTLTWFALRALKH